MPFTPSFKSLWSVRFYVFERSVTKAAFDQKYKTKSSDIVKYFKKELIPVKAEFSSVIAPVFSVT